jgi:hypothetical protein
VKYHCEVLMLHQLTKPRSTTKFRSSNSKTLLRSSHDPCHSHQTPAEVASSQAMMSSQNIARGHLASFTKPRIEALHEQATDHLVFAHKKVSRSFCRQSASAHQATKWRVHIAAKGQVAEPASQSTLRINGHVLFLKLLV